MYKVVLIVDFTPFAFSLTTFIGKTLQIQKVFVSIEEALVPTEDDKHNPDFIIINLSEINLTTEVFNHLKGNYPNASIILISSYRSVSRRG